MGAPGPSDGQFVLQLLDRRAKPTGAAVSLPNCYGTAESVSAAWGDGVLAVAGVNYGSGVTASSICVTLMGCR